MTVTLNNKSAQELCVPCYQPVLKLCFSFPLNTEEIPQCHWAFCSAWSGEGSGCWDYSERKFICSEGCQQDLPNRPAQGIINVCPYAWVLHKTKKNCLTVICLLHRRRQVQWSLRSQRINFLSLPFHEMTPGQVQDFVSCPRKREIQTEKEDICILVF